MAASEAAKSRISGPHAVSAAGVEGRDAPDISDPAHQLAIGHDPDAGQPQDEGKQRQDDRRDRIEPGAGHQAAVGCRQKDPQVVARHRREGVDAVAAGPVPILPEDRAAAVSRSRTGMVG